MMPSETSSLLDGHQGDPIAGETSRKRAVAAGTLLALAFLAVSSCRLSSSPSNTNVLSINDVDLLQESLSEDLIFEPQKRCHWVKDRFDEKNVGKSSAELAMQYATQGTDFNVFYRATANLFWQDFHDHDWGKKLLPIKQGNNIESSLRGTTDIPLSSMSSKSTWTWVTGDQHLSNFGAWQNRHGEIVFSVNDFDEAAIYDFQIDVLRIAVSICNHALTNGFKGRDVRKILKMFTDAYVSTVQNYEDNEKALLFELTPKTAHGKLKKFLVQVEKKKSADKQLEKFTDDNEAGVPHFVKGPVDVPDNETDLASVPKDIEQEIRNQFTSTKYGATLMKLGWNVHPWDDNYFTVLDVAERIGSGVGSFGVNRYYVLLKGTDGLLGEDGEDGTAVILDVKYEPEAAVSRVLNEDDKAWYDVIFSGNPAERVVQAQRRLTSYTDPFTGWIFLENEYKNGTLPFYVRQRSPWKASLDLDKLTRAEDFEDFVSQIATATATSHVRGSVAKAPGDFKHVISELLGTKTKRKSWGKDVARLAKKYHEQVLLDFDCFREVFVTYTAP